MKKMEKEYFTTEMFDVVNESTSKNIARKKAECKLDRAKKLLRNEYNNGELEYLKTKWVSKIIYFLWGALSIALATGVLIAVFYVFIWSMNKVS